MTPIGWDRDAPKSGGTFLPSGIEIDAESVKVETGGARKSKSRSKSKDSKNQKGKKGRAKGGKKEGKGAGWRKVIIPRKGARKGRGKKGGKK
jgi:hypothetical protein